MRDLGQEPRRRFQFNRRIRVESAKARAAELGFQVDEFALGRDGPSPGRLAEILRARGIQALFLVGPFLRNAIPPALSALWRDACCVVVGEHPSSPPFSCVMNDQFANARRAMAEVLARGYKRPGLCLHPDLDGVLQGRFRGGYLLGAEHLRACPPVFDFEPGGEKSFLRWVHKW